MLGVPVHATPVSSRKRVRGCAGVRWPCLSPSRDPDPDEFLLCSVSTNTVSVGQYAQRTAGDWVLITAKGMRASLVPPDAKTAERWALVNTSTLVATGSRQLRGPYVITVWEYGVWEY